MMGDSDYFCLTFPTTATGEDRALMLAGVLMLDFMYFEKKGNKQGGAGGYWKEKWRNYTLSYIITIYDLII